MNHMNGLQNIGQDDKIKKVIFDIERRFVQTIDMSLFEDGS